MVITIKVTNCYHMLLAVTACNLIQEIYKITIIITLQKNEFWKMEGASVLSIFLILPTKENVKVHQMST